MSASRVVLATMKKLLMMMMMMIFTKSWLGPAVSPGSWSCETLGLRQRVLLSFSVKLSKHTCACVYPPPSSTVWHLSSLAAMSLNRPTGHPSTPELPLIECSVKAESLCPFVHHPLFLTRYH